MEELKAIHARRLWLDATSIIGLVIAVIMTTWVVSNERSQINIRLDKLTTDIATLSVQQAASIANHKDSWTRDDQVQLLSDWCYRAEKENPQWKCPTFTIRKAQRGYDSPDGPQ